MKGVNERMCNFKLRDCWNAFERALCTIIKMDFDWSFKFLCPLLQRDQVCGAFTYLYTFEET